jgi:hypothetical protein
MIEEYNGWTNYATWKINLELFDGYGPFEGFETVIDLANHMQEIAEELIASQCKDLPRNQINLAESFARAFLQETDWVQIARAHFVEPKLEPEVYSPRFDYKDLGYGVELFARSSDPEKTLFIQGDDASQFLDEVANVDDKWKDGEIDICKNLEIIDHIIGNYF